MMAFPVPVFLNKNIRFNGIEIADFLLIPTIAET
jgi:hypothetical protein